MDTTTLLVLVFLLVILGGLVGLGMGVVIGLALGGEQERKPSSVRPAVETRETVEGVPEEIAAPLVSEAELAEGPMAMPAVPEGAAPAAPDQTLGAGQRLGHRPAQWWSVPLAIAVMVVCCLCTFLVAVALRILQASL